MKFKKVPGKYDLVEVSYDSEEEEKEEQPVKKQKKNSYDSRFRFAKKRWIFYRIDLRCQTI